MAFPTLGIIDAFNRADESPIAGGWSGPALGLSNSLAVASNKAVPAAFYGAAYYSSSQYGGGGSGIEIYSTFPAMDGAGFHGLLWHLADPGGSSYDGYHAVADHSLNQVTIYVLTNGSTSALGAAISVTYSAGDAMGIEHIQATGVITLYKKTGGSWSSVDTRTDSTYTSGYFGLYGRHGVNDQFDDFGGGTIASGAVTKRSSGLLLVGCG